MRKKKTILSILKFLVIEHKTSVTNLLFTNQKIILLNLFFCDLHVLLKCICRNLVSSVCWHCDATKQVTYLRMFCCVVARSKKILPTRAMTMLQAAWSLKWTSLSLCIYIFVSNDPFPIKSEIFVYMQFQGIHSFTSD